MSELAQGIESRGIKNYVSVPKGVNINPLLSEQLSGYLDPQDNFPGLYKEYHLADNNQTLTRFLLKWDENHWLNLEATEIKGVYKTLPFSSQPGTSGRNINISEWPYLLVSYDATAQSLNTIWLNSGTFMNVPPTKFMSPDITGSESVSIGENKAENIWLDKSGRTQDGRKLVWAGVGEKNGRKIYLELEQDSIQPEIFWRKSEGGEYQKFTYNMTAKILSEIKGSGNIPGVKVQSFVPSTEIVIPVDGVYITSDKKNASIDLNGYNTSVRYDEKLGTWREVNVVQHDFNLEMNDPVWWDGKEWNRGTIEEFLEAKRNGDIPAPIKKMTVVLPAGLPQISKPSELHIVPQEYHHIWVGKSMMSDSNIQNIIDNSESSYGFRTTLHLDVPKKIFDDLKTKFEGTDVELKNIRQEPFFSDFSRTNAGKMYEKAVNGPNSNGAMATDIMRIKVVNENGGIYMDNDDRITRFPDDRGLFAAKGDILLGDTRLATNDAYGNSYFASLKNNPLLNKVLERIERNASNPKYKDMLDSPRPYKEGNNYYVIENGIKITTTRAHFDEYKTKLFEFAGPMLMSDVIREQRPDYFNVGLNAARYHDSLVYRTSSGYDAEDIFNHYFPFGNEFKISAGADNTWELSR